MTKTTQTARERIGHALYMLAAGADPELFLDVLRTYVLQHIETTDQAVELLRDLARVNPPACAEALQILAAEKKHRVNDMVAQIQQQNAAIQKEVGAALTRHKPATARTAKAQPKKPRRVARPHMGRHANS